ncbi:MAG: hypothetical protein KAH23_03200 [Kiritimatiellae bacterium]|nr:hypothetical protein [Kiritimatiellia bacterium]
MKNYSQQDLQGQVEFLTLREFKFGPAQDYFRQFFLEQFIPFPLVFPAALFLV